MNNCKRYSCGLLGILAGLCGGIAGPVSADTFTFLRGDANSNAVNISADGGAHFINGWTGVYQGQLTTPQGVKTVNLFCTDINHDVYPGNTYQIDLSHNLTDAAGSLYTSGGNTYYNGGLASVLASGDFGAIHYDPSQPASATNVSWSQRASQAAWLADQFQNATQYSGASGTTDSSKNASAVNMAIWDIVQDGGDGIHVGNGKVVTDASGFTNYSNLVNYYEVQAAAHSDYTSTTAKFAQSPLYQNVTGGHYQDFIYSTAMPTPEAGTAIALMLLTSGGILLGGRRRKAAASQTA